MGLRSFLKLRPTSTEFPEHSDYFKYHYDNCFNSLFPLAQKCFTILASELQSNGDPYIASDLEKDLLNKMSIRSSISVINYFSIPKPIILDDIWTNNFFIPSNVHQDTGILTFIMCSDVPALQVRARGSNEWTTVEKLADPGTDLFCILGKKMEILRSNQNEDLKYEATWHRVILPYDTKRDSLLLFLDVPV